MTKTKFEKLSSGKQWKWLIENKDKYQHVMVDNDQILVVFRGEDSEFWRLSNSGIFPLLWAVGINAEPA